MNKKITPEQTKQLFLFCHKHFVYHYDLQLELVDHLASSIEKQWEENPEIPFEKALQKTFRKFGVTGFSKVKVEKERALRKKYNRLFWKYLLDFYRCPKMVLTVACTLGLVVIFQLLQNVTYVLVSFFLLLVISTFIYVYRFAPKNFKLDVIPGKKFLLLEQLRLYQFSGILLCQLPINIYNIAHFIDATYFENYWLLFFTALLSVFLTIIFVGSIFYVPQNIKKHFMEQFGEFAV